MSLGCEGAGCKCGLGAIARMVAVGLGGGLVVEETRGGRWVVDGRRGLVTVDVNVVGVTMLDRPGRCLRSCWCVWRKGGRVAV
jgi:hypothetical protein